MNTKKQLFFKLSNPCFALFLVLFFLNSHAKNKTEISLPSGNSLLTQEYKGDGEKLLIWIPSQYGIRKDSALFAKRISNEGTDFWLVDLHSSYMAPEGARAYQEFEYQDIFELIEYAQNKGWKKIFIGGSGRAAILTLNAVRQWQKEHKKDKTLKGMVFFHPHLIDGYTEIGDQAHYLNITRETNLPIYLIQPEYSTKYLKSKELLSQLKIGGSKVFFHPLKGIVGGYHIRPDEDLSETDIKEKEKAGTLVNRALKILESMPLPDEAAPEYISKVKRVEKKRSHELRPMPVIDAPPLKIKDADDKPFILENYKGQVVLINFWATWCGPCIEEIPSIMRLKQKFEGQPFQVVAINIAETPKHVLNFFNKLKIKPNFDVLFDTQGTTINDWKIYAYPSNYLLDKNHKIRYAYRGALHWDNEQTTKIVKKLVNE